MVSVRSPRASAAFESSATSFGAALMPWIVSVVPRRSSPPNSITRARPFTPIHARSAFSSMCTRGLAATNASLACGVGNAHAEAKMSATLVRRFMRSTRIEHIGADAGLRQFRNGQFHSYSHAAGSGSADQGRFVTP
jgi:hypothetical protein